jgi:hypothetical protein
MTRLSSSHCDNMVMFITSREYGYGQPWSFMENNCQTWLAIVNHGQPQSTMVMVNQGKARSTIVMLSHFHNMVMFVTLCVHRIGLCSSHCDNMVMVVIVQWKGYVRHIARI